MIFWPLRGRLCGVVIQVVYSVGVMPEADVGYDSQDGPKDIQNGHDGQGQRYGHLCTTAKQKLSDRSSGGGSTR